MISNKLKITLIAVCAVLIMVVFAVNVTERVSKDTDPMLDSVVKHSDENSVTRAYFSKMISLLQYSREELDLLDYSITYEDVDKEEWDSKYINALNSMNVNDILTGEGTRFEPEKKITYLECQKIVVKLAEHIDNKQIEKDLPQLFKEETYQKEISWDEFLVVYEYLIENVYTSKTQTTLKDSMKTVEFYIVGTKKNIESLNDFVTVTDLGQYTNDGLDLDDYIDLTVKVYVKDNEILYMNEVLEEDRTLSNVYITGQDGETLHIYVNGVEREFTMNNKVDQDVTKQIADVVISKQKIKDISLKPETIRAKVLVAKEDYIELDGYGKLPVDDNFRVYKIYDGIAMEMTNAILVGYENTDFVICDGKLCAALITEEIHAQDIRVILYNTDFKSLYHNKVTVTSDSSFTITYGKNKKTFKAGKEVSITSSSDYMDKGRVKIKPDKEDGKITILSIERTQGNPSYRGTIEIASTDSGLTIVNELPLEEYLYAVIPSEMPVTYGIEALKVQAICARSYAYNHLVLNSCSKYGAHVDDSTTYQVYNNHEETDLSIQAVKDTYGQVLQYNNEVVFAYYFSTSCGTTADVKSVWLTSDSVEYLQGKFQGSDKGDDVNYSDEKAFYEFIKSTDIDAYEKDCPWFRWNVTIDFSDLKKMIDSRLLSLYKKKPSYVLTKDSDGVYKKTSINTVGTIKDINVSKRDSSGLATEIIIKGSKNTIKVKSESYIRQLLGPSYDAVTRKDKKQVEGLSLLPSAFIVMDKVKDDDGKITGVKISGGGYGHGVGMSQNGVKVLVDSGKSYEDVLKHYYTGIAIGCIY